MKKRFFLLLVILALLVVAGCQNDTESLVLPHATRPTPKPSTQCPSAVHSPSGSVTFGTKACSPDGIKYAREVEPANQGQIGIFDAQTDELKTIVNMRETNNYLKGLSWSPPPNQSWLAIMYHHSPGGYISIVDGVTTKEIERLRIDKWYHRMEFSQDGRAIVAEGKVLPLKVFSAAAKSETHAATTSTSAPEPGTPMPTKPPNTGTRPPVHFQKGISYVSWWPGEYSTAASDEALRQLAATGASWVAILVTGYQDEIASTTINRNSSGTPSDADLVHAIAAAHRLGLHVMLKPHVDVNDPTYWRGQIGIRFTSEQQWQTWFDSYRQFITHYESRTGMTRHNSRGT